MNEAMTVKYSLMKRFFIFIFFFLLTLSFSLKVKSDNLQNTTHAYKGIVKEILLDNEITLREGEKQRQQLLKVKLSDDREIEALNTIPLGLSYQVLLKKGDKILVSEEDGLFNIEGYNRESISWILLFLFTALLVGIGGKKGALAFISLIIKISILLFILIPSIKAGYSPLLTTSLFCAIATCLTIAMVSGLNYKTLAACIGTIGGVLAAGLIGYWAVNASHMSGLLEPEMESLFYQFPKIKLTELISAGVLIGALGAAMDVAISIASALQEIKLAAPEMAFKELYKSGMNIGRDVMGTMINTLILAYAGSSLPTIILITQIDTAYLFNMELFIKELILSAVGSIGLILTIPITSLLAAYLMSKMNDKKKSI
jgi:uncharacterized membrane protein